MQFMHIKSWVWYSLLGSSIRRVTGNLFQINRMRSLIYLFVTFGNERVQLSTDFDDFRLLIRMLVHWNQPFFRVHAFIILFRTQRRNEATVLMHRASFRRVVNNKVIVQRFLGLNLNQNIVFELSFLNSLLRGIYQAFSILDSLLPLPFVVDAIVPVHFAIAVP